MNEGARRRYCAPMLTFAAMTAVFLLQFGPWSLFYAGAWTSYSDEDAYLAHALTLGLDFDLDYSNEPITALNPQHTAPRHPIGPGLLAAPFVAAFSVVDRLTDQEVIRDHHAFLASWSLFGFLFSKVVYLFAALWLYRDIVRRLGPGRTCSGELFLYVAGSGLLYYVLYRFAMAHSFEFFVHAIVLQASVVVWQRLRGATDVELKTIIAPALIAEGAAALNLLIRPSNVNVLFLPLLAIETLFLASGDRPRSLTKVYVLCGVALALSCAPVVAMFFRFYGKAYPNVYDQYGLHVPALEAGNLVSRVVFLVVTLVRATPFLFHLLFSGEFGLLYTNPIVAVGVVLALARGIGAAWSQPTAKHVALVVALLAYVGQSVAIVLLWQTPGMDYGYRYLFSLYPLGFLGYMLWLREARTGTPARRRLGQAVRVAVLGFSVFSIASQQMYGATDRLVLSDRSLSLGFIEGPTAKHYEQHVATDVWRLDTWRGVLLVRLPAYVAIKAIPLRSEDFFAFADRIGLSRDQVIRQIDVLNRTTDSAPSRVSMQIGALSAFWVAVAWGYVRSDRFDAH